MSLSKKFYNKLSKKCYDIMNMNSSLGKCAFSFSISYPFMEAKWYCIIFLPKIAYIIVYLFHHIRTYIVFAISFTPYVSINKMSYKGN